MTNTAKDAVASSASARRGRASPPIDRALSRLRWSMGKRDTEQTEQHRGAGGDSHRAAPSPRVPACRRRARRRSSRSCRARGCRGTRCRGPSSAGTRASCSAPASACSRARRRAARRRTCRSWSACEAPEQDAAAERDAAPRGSAAVAKKRSATMPTKNGDIIAATAVVPIGESDLLTGEAQRLPQPRPHRHRPRPPDEVLEEHQRGELQRRSPWGSCRAAAFA